MKVYSRNMIKNMAARRSHLLRLALTALLLLAGGGMSGVWATDYVFVMLGAPDGNGHRPVTAKFKRTDKNWLDQTWQSPLVNEYRYYKAATDNGDGTFTVADADRFTSNIFNTFETCYVTYDNYDTRPFEGIYRIFVKWDGNYNYDNNNHKYMYARTDGIYYTGGDGSYENPDLWTLTGDPYSAQFHPYSKQTECLTAVNSETDGDIAAADLFASGSSYKGIMKLKVDDGTYHFNKFMFVGQANKSWSIRPRINQWVADGTIMEAGNSDAKSQYLNWLSNTEPLKTWRDWSDSPTYLIKTDPAKNYRRWHIMNGSGVQEALYETKHDYTVNNLDRGFPMFVRSPLASNYRFYTDAAMTQELNPTTYYGGSMFDAIPDVYVKYDYDATIFDGSTDYHIQYMVNNNQSCFIGAANGNNELTKAADEAQATAWRVQGTPYSFTIKSSDGTKRMTVPTLNNSEKVYSDASSRGYDTYSATYSNFDRPQFGIFVNPGANVSMDYNARSYFNGASTFQLSTSTFNTISNNWGSMNASFVLANKVKYHVITLDRTKIAITATTEDDVDPFGMPDYMKSPLATNFRYWKTATVNGSGQYVVSDEITNGTVPSTKDVYVTYEYSSTPAAGKFDLNAGTSYLIKSKTGYMYNNVTNNDVNSYNRDANNTYQLRRDVHLWFFNGQDPYDIKITSKANPTYMLAKTSNDVASFYTRLETDDNASHIQRFILLKNPLLDTYELMGACTPTTNPQDYFYLQSPTGDYMHVYALPGSQTGSENIQLTITPYRRYHIIRNDAGDEAITAQVKDESITPSVPAELRTPVLRDEDYTYYATLEDAKAKTNAISSTWGYTDIYVRYTYSATTNPSDIQIESGAYYAIKFVDGGVDRYLQSWGNNPGGNDYRLTADNGITERPWKLPRQWFMWYFEGDDPYWLTIRNSYKEGKVLSKRDHISYSHSNNGANDNAYMENPDNSSYVQHYFITQDPDNTTTYQIAASENNSGTHDGLIYYLFHGGNNNWIYMDGQGDVQTGAARAQVVLEPYRCYHVIDNSDEQAVEAFVPERGDKTATIPDVLYSPLVQGYTFHDTQANAIAGSGVITSESGHRDLYVRYTYDNSLSPLDLSGNTWYNFQFTASPTRWGFSRGQNHMQLANNPTSEKLITNVYMWHFTGNDPYRIQIASKEYPSLVITKRSLTRNQTTEMYNMPDGTANSIQTFSFTQASGRSTYQLLGNYLPTEYINEVRPFYYGRFNNNDWPYISCDNAYQHDHDWTQLQFSIPLHQYIVNSQGVIALDGIAHLSSQTLTVDARLKTPYMPLDANYKFFLTKEAAAAYSSATTDEARATAAAAAVTLVSQLGGSDVYIGYHYDDAAKAARPVTLPILDGSKLYAIKAYADGENFRYYYTQNTVSGRPSGKIGIKGSTTTPTDDATYGDYYYWTFSGDDPYAIVVTNSVVGTHVYANPTANSWGCDYELNSTLSLPMVMLSDDVREGSYTLAYYRPTYALGTREHIANWGYDKSNNVVQLVRTQRTPIDTYYSLENTFYGHLTFPAAPQAFTFHLPTAISGTELPTITTFIETRPDNETLGELLVPTAMRRRYISNYEFYTAYDGTQTNYEDRFSGKLNTYADLKNAPDDIYIKYTVGTLPFTVSTDWSTARWYRIQETSTPVFVHLSETAQVTGANDIYTLDYQYAFFGDPYELKVANRVGGEGTYLGVAAGATTRTLILPIATGLNTWEILPKESEADDAFRLRAFATAANPRYCGFQDGKAYYTDVAAITMRAVELPQRYYDYVIIDRTGRKAISQTIKQDVYTPISYANLPAAIASPYIADETIRGYLTANDTGSDAADGRDIFNLTDLITMTPENLIGKDGLSQENAIPVYINYSVDHLLEKPLRLDGRRAANVIQVSSSNYMYATSTSTEAKKAASDAEKKTRPFIWTMENSDPYAVQLKNSEYNTSFFKIEVSVNTSTTPPTVTATTSLDAATDPNTFFVLLDGEGTGENKDRQVKFTLASGGSNTDGEKLRFESNLPSTTYYIIDKANMIVISAPAAEGSGDLQVPAAIASPLVGKYKYWKLSDFTVDANGEKEGNGGGTPNDVLTTTYSDRDDLYTLKDGATELNNLAEAIESGVINIYVTYEANNSVDFDTTDDDARGATMYLLKFANGVFFKQEDGADDMMKVEQKAVYPYSNGDANLYVYGQEQWVKQLESGASTRTRWPWYVVSANRDPYHVKIMSYQDQGKSTSHNYLYTHVENFKAVGENVVANHVVTGVTTRGDRVTEGGTKDDWNFADLTKYPNQDAMKQKPTEYMVLGTDGHNFLYTVENITATGIADDATYGQHRVVKSFEQYWKTYDTAHKKIVDKDYKDNSSDPILVPSEYHSTLETLGWHGYDAWANAKQWNGYNRVSNKAGKDYDYMEHWFQTISMGDGDFTFEEVSLDPQLILIDQHGWEIVRLPLPKKQDDAATRSKKLANIAIYQSPMVQSYKWWTTGSKAPGYHKYKVSNPQINVYKASGTKWVLDEPATTATYDASYMTTTMLTDIPYDHIEITPGGTAKNFDDNSQDLYVTYIVKPEYTAIYQGATTEGATRASAFLVKMGGNFAKATNATTMEAAAIYTGEDDMLWYLRPNFNIDAEMGYIYNGIYDEKSKVDTEADYLANGQNGFDPYNMQIQSKAFNTGYLQTTANGAGLSKGTWSGTYEGTATLFMGEATSKFTATGYDQTTCNVTNTTFMVLDDGNGNKHLMPRFDHSRIVQSSSAVVTLVEKASWRKDEENDDDGIQTLLIGKPTTYTYHVINHSGHEAITYKEKHTAVGVYRPALPDFLQAYGAKDFRYLPLSEFDPEAYANGYYTLVNKNAQSREVFSSMGEEVDIYVVYSINVEAMTTKGFDGLKPLNIQMRRNTSTDLYLSYENSAVTTNTSLADAKDMKNLWRIASNEYDPYDVHFYSFSNAYTPMGVNVLNTAPTIPGESETRTYNEFIITNWNSAENRFELLAARSGDYNSTDGNTYAYLTFNGTDGNAVVQVYRNKDRQHNTVVASNIVGFKIYPQTLDITYKLYDLAGNLTLEGTAVGVSSLTPSLPENMRSPLVKEYQYYQDIDLSKVITSLSQTIGNTVYVDYEAIPLEEAMLKLDGSVRYTLHHKSQPERIIQPGNPNNLATTVGRRENNYEWTLIGRNIDGRYDPYDVAVYSPTFRVYWQSTVRNSDDESNWTSTVTYNGQNTNKRFMILGGTSDESHSYVEIQVKKVDGSSYYSSNMDHYQYVYLDGNNMKTMQDKNSASRTHEGADVQWFFQPTYIYHVINMSGKESVSGVEPRLVTAGTTEVRMPEVLKSIVVNNYHFYDRTSFDVSDDGVFTLKSGAAELQYVSEATTHDIYVTYTNADIDKSWDLNGNKVYNIVFATDADASYGDNNKKGTDEYKNAIKQSYMWYGTYFSESTKRIQTRGSYYDGGWQYQDIDPASVTDEQKNSDAYLWFFMGGDPYSLTVHNMEQGKDKYIVSSGTSGYHLNTSLGTTSSEAGKRFILTGHLNANGEPRFNIMTETPVTSGLGTYGYVYLGRTYHDNPHRNGRLQVLWINNDWAYNYMYDCPVNTFKMELRKESSVTYVVKNLSGTEAIRYKTKASSGMPPELPLDVKSPYAKNFMYWSDATCETEKTVMTDDDVIYVTYERDDAALSAANIELNGGSSYNVRTNGQYLFNNSGSLLATASPQKLDDGVLLWQLTGNDPYAVQLQNVYDGTKYVRTSAAFDNTKSVQTMTLGTAENVSTFILMNGQPGNYELLAATQGSGVVDFGSPAVTQNRFAYLGYTTSTNLVGWGNGKDPLYQSGQRFVQVQIRQPLSGITYHVINLAGNQAVQYTADGVKGDALEVPEQIRSPFATNWRYYNDEACTQEITTVPNAGAHIYCTYTYDDSTADALQIDGQRFYNMLAAGRWVREDEGDLLCFKQASLTNEEQVLTANLWAMDGNTSAYGIDPYQLHLVNRAYSDIYAGGVMDYVDNTEDVLHLSNGEESFRSTFFLVGSSTDGPFEMVLASGVNVTDNELVYVARHDETELHLEREAEYQHGSDATQIQFTVPHGRYLYKVYNRKGELAVQAWGEGMAGGTPEIPAVIKSPLVSRYYYDVETLPYTIDDNEVRITYDVADDDPELAPVLNGTKRYNVKFHDNNFFAATSATTLAVTPDNTNTNKGDANAASDQFIWTPNDVTDGKIDPYDITLRHSNGSAVYATSIDAGAQTLSLGTPGENDFGKFILISGNGDNIEFMAASADKISDNQFAYLGLPIEGTTPQMLRGDAYTQEKTAIQVQLVPFRYTYTYIVINKQNKMALRYATILDGGDKVFVPKAIRSPLIATDKFHYYAHGTEGITATYDQKEYNSTTYTGQYVENFSITGTPAEISVHPYTDQTIYVTYDYVQAADGLDLTGMVKYQIYNPAGYVNEENTYMRALSDKNNNVRENHDALTDHTTEAYQWRLENSDPYDVKIRTTVASSGKYRPLTAWNIGVDNRALTLEDEGGNPGDGGKADTYAILAHEDGDYRLMAITPHVWKADRMTPIRGNNDQAYFPINSIYNNNVQAWRLQRYFLRDGEATVEEGVNAGLRIVFAPVTTHNFRYHLTTQIDLRNIIVEKPKTMARSVFQLPEELKRKYCTYTVTYYMKKNGSEDEANWTPATKDEALDGVGNVNSGYERKSLDPTSATELFPYYKYADDHQKDVDANGNYTCWIDVYVDYEVITHFKRDSNGDLIPDGKGSYEVNPNGIPFNRMGYDRATTHALLDNQQYAETLFQISTYDQLTEKVGSRQLQRKDYLYFMVLNTDNEFTNQNGQYFLRRQNDGSVAYLNNDYRLHVNPEDNHNGWTYSRVAESYKAGDNAVFEEKRWLWCFAGDPYDLYIFNASAVVEETFNTVSGKTEVTTHRDHLVDYARITSASGNTHEYVVDTPGYEETTGTLHRWGLAEGKGDNSNGIFSLVSSEFFQTGTNEYKNPTIPTGDPTNPRPADYSEYKPVYWTMGQSKVSNKQQVMLKERDEATTSLAYNIKLLPYVPVNYVDMRLVFRRDDYVDNTTTNPKASSESYLNKYPNSSGQPTQEMMRYIDNLPTGTVRMYTVTEDRRYAVGDKVDINNLPMDIRRQFCNYTGYSDDYRNSDSIYVITEQNVAYRGEVQRYTEDTGNHKKGDIVYNAAGKPMYNYWKYVWLNGEKQMKPKTDPETGQTIIDPETNQPVMEPVTRDCPPTTAYIKYEVTTDKFLKTAPTRDVLQTMVENNDHVWFMDFADPNLLKGEKLGYDNGHHAYYDDDPEMTYQKQIGQVHGEVLAEKMIWNGEKFVYDTGQPYNYNHFHTTNNRMESVPEKLKWYFVGDPYNMQVYCTKDDYNRETVLGADGQEKEAGIVPSNLCRFDPTETAFQFVVDCVHFRTSDYGLIDEREKVDYRNTDGSTVEVDNANQGNPYYANFYWEVVPTTTDDPEAFALRFRADNPLLGYRDVYYYLAHDGLKRTYREAISDNPKAYPINLSYDETNTFFLSGKYKGYHASNNNYTAIRLTQPSKVYFSAYKETYSGEAVVTEELSEYFGVGETLKEVPRHLQRKFVKYGNLQYQKNNNSEWITGKSFPITLVNKKVDEALTGEAAAFNLEDCDHYEASNAFQNGTTKRVSYKFRVTYSVDDITKDNVHLFTTAAEFANPDVRPQWLDVSIGGNSWMYYDKTNVVDDTNAANYREEDETERVSAYPINTSAVGAQQSGWYTGIKGLHWAFVGDPYKFTVISQRRWEDCGSPREAVSGSTFWLGTGYGKHNQEETKDGTKQKWDYNYTRIGDTNANSEYGGHNGAGGNDANGNTEWSLMMCKTGGDSDYFIRTSSRKQNSVSDLVGDYANEHSPSNMTNDYARIVRKDFVNNDGTTDPNKSAYVLETFSLDTKTSDIHKADIRTAVAEDDDRADNDCFDANVHIYNTNGELKATLKHVELKYGEVFETIPSVLRRYGCSYIECYQLGYAGFTPTEIDGNHETARTAKRTAINTQLQNLNNFSGDNKKGSLNTFGAYGDGTLDDSKMILDDNGRKYYEIAYVYSVDTDVAQFFTNDEDAEKEEYTWINANYQWDQVYKGSNVRVITYEDVFDHYEYNADGHIVNEVYKKVEKVTYKSGDNISTPAYGWVNTHTGSNKSFGDEGTQSEDNRQKWALVGDPYDFEMKNYDLFLQNSNTAMVYDTNNGVTNSTTAMSHWAIVQGLQKTEVRDGKVVNVTDDNGNPVYVYYLALIDDDPLSETYGEAINFVTFDRARDNKDLSKEEQYLKLRGAPVGTDPTGSLYTQETKDVHPFYISNLLNYANMVIYHLVIAHQHSTDYIDANLTDAEKSTVRRHLAEYLHYHLGKPVTGNTTFDDTYLTSAGIAFDYKNDDTYMQLDFKNSYQNASAQADSTSVKSHNATDWTNIRYKQKQGTLRDLITDPVKNYIVQRVGIGNALSVPWYMKRQFCNYDLYQRNVYRSETDYDSPVYEEADDSWKGLTLTIDGVKYKYDPTNLWAGPDGRVQKTFTEGGIVKGAYNVKWVPVDEDKTYYSEIQKQNGTKITNLSEQHRNRMVLIDVVYHVNPEEFRFADRGRNTTAWYSMLTNNDADGLMNFSYLNGVGARHDRTAHYTNNYLWAPEGDPYGFILHSRYATINGTGWDNVVITTSGELPTTSSDSKITTYTDYTTETGSTESDYDRITYTGAGNSLVKFQQKRIKHPGRTTTGDDLHHTWGARNAVYEMYEGMNSYSFLMHPTAAYVDADGDKFSSFYVVHNTTDAGNRRHTAELIYEEDAQSARHNRDANWRLMTTPEQLLPYFERAGYVGGLKPEVAVNFSNQTMYNTLQNYAANYRQDPSVINFRTIDRARQMVYEGKFYKRGGNGNPYNVELNFWEERPTNDVNNMPLKFVSTNLVPLTKGYYRIKAFSEAALDHDGTLVNGIVGPRYVSGYRFLSEKTKAGFEDKDSNPATDPTLENGSRWLHFVATDAAHTPAALDTWGELNDHLQSLASTAANEYHHREIEPHPAMRGNIDLPVAEYDPSSIFYFTPSDGGGDSYDRWNISTQGLRLRARAGGVQGTDYAYEGSGITITDNDPNYGQTKLVDMDASVETGFDDNFRVIDVGGTAVTMRLRKYAINDNLLDDNGNITSTKLDTWDKTVGENIKHNYLCIDGNHRYRVTMHKNNEMAEIGDQLKQWETDGLNYSIQDTKWLLQPVGTQTAWPYNEMPLRVKVNKGGTGDDHYYASLYVPFDTRLGSTVDAAFTAVNNPDKSAKTVRMTSLSLLNNKNNPLFIPADWPVVIRTNNPKDKAGTPYVELDLPTTEPTTVGLNANKNRILLKGEYLEQLLNDPGTNKSIMVFGLPFEAKTGNKEQYSTTGDSYIWYAYDKDKAVGFYTNENWYRGHENYSSVATQKAFNDLGSAAQRSVVEVGHWGTARTATSLQRENLYVYSNKAYYIYDSSALSREYFRAIFGDEEEDDEEDHPIDEDLTDDGSTPWPCDVYDLSGRRVAENETPATLLRNHPALRKGVYIFGGRKVVVR